MKDWMRRPGAQVVTAIGALAVVKIALSLELELTSLEAYYWMYSRHPALGYFDHPAMVSWMVWLSTSLFGHSTLGVRMVPIVLSALGAWFVFLAGRRLYDERTGRLAALMTALVPMTLQNSTEACPDGPLLFAWCGVLWTLAHALTAGSPRWWYAAGAFLGVGMMSKYNGVFVGVGVLLLLVFSAEHRGWLKRKEPYLAALVALLVFSPTILWNAQNGWASLKYQSVGRMEEGGGFTWKHVIDFPLRQLQYLTPVACLAGWWAGLAAIARWKPAAGAARLLATQSMPLHLFMFYSAFRRSVRSHWAAPAAPALLLGAAEAIERGPRWIRLANGAVLGLLGLGLVLLPVGLLFIPRAQLTGWDQLASRVKERSPGFVMARDYHDASQMGYHCRPVEAVDFTAVGRGSKSFPNWWEAERHRGERAVIVYEEGDFPDSLDAIRSHFERVSEPELIEIPRFAGKKEKRQRFLLLVADGYKGRVAP